MHHRTTQPLGRIWSALAAVCVSACLAALAAGQAQEDLGALYLDAYMLADEATTLQKEGKYREALSKNYESIKILDAIATNYPTWRREVVTYRRKQVNASIAKCQVHVPGEAPGESKGYQRPRPEAYVPRTTDGSTGEGLVRQKDHQIQQLLAELQGYERNLSSAQLELEKTKLDLSRSNSAKETLMYELGTAREKLAKSSGNSTAMKKLESDIKRLTNELAIANESLAAADKRNEKLTGDLQQAADMVSSLQTERAELKKEREQLDDLLNGAKDSDVKKLIVENRALKKELEAAREEASKLTKEKKLDAEKITGLQDRLAKVEGRLAELQQENTAYRDRIDALNNKLRSTQDSLKKAMSGAGGQAQVAQAALDENETLRQIVKRQIAQQEWRKQAKEILISMVASDRADVKSLVNQLGGADVLTKEEADMFGDSLLGPLGAPTGSSQPDGIIGQAGDTAPSYPQLLGHNDGTRSPSGLNENLTEFARAIIGDFRKGNFPACEAGYMQILDIAPNNIYAMRNLAIVKMRMGKGSDAEAWLRKAIATDSKDDYSHFLLGVLYYRTGNDQQALASMEQGLNIAPRNAKAHNYVGAIYIKRNMRDQARDAFMKVVNIDPSFGDAYYNLAYLYATDEPKNLNLARQMYQMAQKNGTPADAAMDRALGT